MSQKQHNDDRMRRAKSWRERSDATLSDDRFSDDDRFIFLWIAFNAAYGGEPYGLDVESSKLEERDRISAFLDRLLEVDPGERISNLLWGDLSGPIRDLLNNRYVYGPFWYSVRRGVQGSRQAIDWQQKLTETNNRVEAWLRDKRNARGVLWELLMRLYTLRNQILHGGATYGTGKGRGQIRIGTRIMKSLVPEILAAMQADIDKNPVSAVWGVVEYPMVNRSGRVL